MPVFESIPGSPAGDAPANEAPTVAADEQPPVAENVVLSEPVPLPEHTATDAIVEELINEAQATPGDVTVELPEATADPRPIVLLDTTVAVGTSARLSWSPQQSFEGIAAPTPVLVVNGEKPGPTVCLTAAVHGDELNGIEIVRRVLYDLTPDKLAGTVIGVPIVNLQGFRRSSRYLPDRRDLNRFFPGNPTGSSASRIAYSFFNEVITHCDALIDLHTGSFHRTNLPQLRADLTNPQIARLTEKFGATVVLHSRGARGTLRRAAADAGIPAVTLEAGEPARVQEDAVSHGKRGIMTLLNELDMVGRVTFWGNREPVYYRSKWIRADQGGVLISDVELGQRVRAGQVLGTVTDPITNVQSNLVAKSSGRVLGMALNQFVMPGFAAYRVGIEESDHPIVITPSDGLDDEEDELAEEEEGSALVEDAEIKAVDARDYLEDSE
jgi:predicted deacylase